MQERAFDDEIERLGQRWQTFREPGQQTEADALRLRDVSIMPLDAIADCLDQTAVLTVAAILLVEIVSESTTLRDDRDKVNEHQAKGIREYWIVDPIRLDRNSRCLSFVTIRTENDRLQL